MVLTKPVAGRGQALVANPNRHPDGNPSPDPDPDPDLSPAAVEERTRRGLIERVDVVWVGGGGQVRRGLGHVAGGPHDVEG